MCPGKKKGRLLPLVRNMMSPKKNIELASYERLRIGQVILIKVYRKWIYIAQIANLLCIRVTSISIQDKLHFTRRLLI